jgi:hypothetical protein
VGVTERVTIAFADASAALQGVAIAGVGTLLARGARLTAATAPQLSGDDGAWRVSAGDDYELALTAGGDGAALADGTRIWLCRATGTIGVEDFDGRATLTRGPAGADAVERSLAILFEDQLGFALAARGPRDERGHDEEQLEAIAFRGEPLEPATIEKPRLSTTFDAEGRLIRAGVELWETADAEFALRIGGETLAHGELVHPDGARTQIAFIGWHHDGHRGPGSYAITTPARA